MRIDNIMLSPVLDRDVESENKLVEIFFKHATYVDRDGQSAYLLNLSEQELAMLTSALEQEDLMDQLPTNLQDRLEHGIGFIRVSA